MVVPANVAGARPRLRPHRLGSCRDLKLDRVEQVTVAQDHELKQHYELSDEYGD